MTSTSRAARRATSEIDFASWAATAVQGLEDWTDSELWVLALPKRVGTRRRIGYGISVFYVSPWLLDDPVARDGLEFVVPSGDTSLVRDPRGVVCDWRHNDEALLIDPVSWIRTKVTLAG